MSARCVECGALNPWNPETDAELYGYWAEQHPGTEDSPVDAAEETGQAAAARTYGAGGWAVFPVWWPREGVCACPQGALCKSPGKHPIFAPAHPRDSPERETCRGECGRVGHGLHDATADEDVLAGWWARYPLANIGLPAGANGLAVVDVDNEESFGRLREYLASKGRPLPETLTQITGSGKRHFVFAEPEGGAKTGSHVFGLRGIDCRGRGGYIVASPSEHAAGGRYEWVDPFVEPVPWPDLLTRLMNPPKAKPAPAYTGPRKPIGDRYVEKAVTDEVDAVRSASEGGRNDRLNRAAFNLGQFVGAGLLDEMVVRRELYRAALACGLGEKESAATILSGLRGGIASPRGGRTA